MGLIGCPEMSVRN